MRIAVYDTVNKKEVSLESPHNEERPHRSTIGTLCLKKMYSAEKKNLFTCKNKTIVGHSLDNRYVIQPRGGKGKED